jgi:hypothetical protein
LCREDSEIRRGRGIVKPLDESDSARTLTNVGILGGNVGIAAWDFAMNKVIDTAQRGWGLKEGAWKRLQFVGPR